jgi:prophage antirepressor-like protein
MADIILFHFEQSEVRTGELDGKPVFCLSDLLLSMDSKTDTNKAKASVEEIFGDGQFIELPIVDNLGREQNALFVFEAAATFLVARSRTPKGKRLNRWIHEEVLPSIRKTGSYSIESDRQKLERKFLPTPALKQLKEMYGIKKMMHGKAYADRWMAQMELRYYPALVGDAPLSTELASLPTATALLKPSDVAIELGWFCKSNQQSGDARRVNKALEALGYQSKIAGQWSATRKAIDANLCDRKPVKTDSRTQKDQLLWSANIVSILQEHSSCDSIA